MKDSVDSNGVRIIETTVGEILSKLAVLECFNGCSVTRTFARKESVKIIRELLKDTKVSILKRDVEEAIKELGKGMNEYVTNTMKASIEKFFKRDKHETL